MGELFAAPVSILFFSASYCNDLFYVFIKMKRKRDMQL